VIDNEILAAAHRVKRGIEVSEETLALDLIQQMQSQAHYLTSDFTLKHYRRELATSNLVNRHRRSAWEKRGAKSLEEAAHAQVEKILKQPAGHRPDGPGLEKVRAIEKKWLRKILG